MRLFFGIILGALLTVGGAYVHDLGHPPVASQDRSTLERPMVNWDVVGDNANALAARLRSEWARLTGGR